MHERGTQGEAGNGDRASESESDEVFAVIVVIICRRQSGADEIKKKRPTKREKESSPTRLAYRCVVPIIIGSRAMLRVGVCACVALERFACLAKFFSPPNEELERGERGKRKGVRQMLRAEKTPRSKGKENQIGNQLRELSLTGPKTMRPPPSLVRHPSTLTKPTRAATGIRNGRNWSDAAAKAAAEAAAQPSRPPEPRRPPPSPRLSPASPPFFSDLGLDRCSAARKDAALLAEISSREGATAIVVRGGDALMM